MLIKSIMLLPFEQKNNLIVASQNKSVLQCRSYASCTHPYNNSYNLAFLGRKDRSENEKAFLRFRQQFAKKLHKLSIEEGKRCWDFYVNSSDENNEKYQAAYKSLLDVYADEETYKTLQKFKEKGISDPKLKKSLDKILKEFNETVKYKSELEKLNDMESEIAKRVNAYQGEVDGEKYSNADLDYMLRTETNPEVREKAYYARKITNANDIAPDLVELVKARNAFAMKNGHYDYFIYKLREKFEVDEEALFKLMEDLDKKTEGIYSSMKAKEYERLAKVFGIRVEDLKPWHYDFQQEGNPIKEADKYITDTNAVQRVAFKMYKQMGWNIAEMPITLDLFPREHKNQHCFCFYIDTNKDARVLANLRRDTKSVETLSHELGHSVSQIGLSDKVSYFDRGHYDAVSEAFAMLMEGLPHNEAVLVKEFNMPADLAQKLKIERLKFDINFIRQCLLFINFEKQMYADPNQDLGELWHSLAKKYLLKNKPPVNNNEWARIPHFLSMPAYYQNYFRANIMVSQMYESASAKLGKLTENPNTAEFFRTKLFRLGTSLEEADLIKKFTGKALSADVLCRSIKELAQYI